MILLWTAIAALSFAWFAGDAVLGLVVAPRLFHHATVAGIGTAFPGLVFGDVLGRWVTIAGLALVIPMLGLFAAACGRAIKRAGVRSALLPLAAMALVLGAHVAAVTMVKNGLDRAEQLRERPDPVKAEEFRTRFHAQSRIVFGAEMLVALAVAVGAALAARAAATLPSRTPPRA
jgi:hypothetical protein